MKTTALITAPSVLAPAAPRGGTLTNATSGIRLSMRGRGGTQTEPTTAAADFDIKQAINGLSRGLRMKAREEKDSIDKNTNPHSQDELKELATVIDLLFKDKGRRLGQIDSKTGMTTEVIDELLPRSTHYQSEILKRLYRKYIEGRQKAQTLKGSPTVNKKDPILREIKQRIPHVRISRLWLVKVFTDHPANPLDSHTLVGLFDRDFDNIVNQIFGETLSDNLIRNIPRGDNEIFPDRIQHNDNDYYPDQMYLEEERDNLPVEWPEQSAELVVDGFNIGDLSFFPGLKTFGGGFGSRNRAVGGVPVVAHESRHHLNSLLGLQHTQNQLLKGATRIEGNITRSNRKYVPAILPLAALWLSGRHYACALMLQDELLAYATDPAMVVPHERAMHLEVSVAKIAGFYMSPFRRISAQFINNLQRASGVTKQDIEALKAYRAKLIIDLEEQVYLGSVVLADLVAKQAPISSAAMIYLGLQPLWHWDSVHL